MTKHSRYSEYILSSDINIATRTTHSVFVYADRRQPRLGSRLWWLEGRQTNTNYLLDENTHHHNTHHAQPQHCCPLHQVSGTWSRGGMQGKVNYAECHKRTFSHFIVLIKFKSNIAHFQLPHLTRVHWGRRWRVSRAASEVRGHCGHVLWQDEAAQNTRWVVKLYLSGPNTHSIFLVVKIL